jgi:GNAT superfamily N-acetyltransferase
VISIRKAEHKDLTVLADFQCALALESENVTLDRPVLEAGLAALLNDPARGVYYLAEEAGHAVGCHMITYEWSDWRNGMVLWLQSVYVRQSHRGKGVFRQMYDNLVAMVQQDGGLRGLRLYVDKTNAGAQKVYEAMGMDGSHYTVYEWMKS